MGAWGGGSLAGEGAARGGSRAAAAALLLAAACAHAPPAPVSATPPAPTAAEARPRPHPVEVGLASYYGHAFQGRRTASGARYDVRALTCAHRTAPFGTVLRVTDVETGRSVEVEVNDRGPFEPGRVVDLSLAAAQRLGMVTRGLARVRVERIAGAGPGT